MSAHYTEYAALDAQIKELEAKKDEVKGLILQEMVDSGEDAVNTEVGKFSVTKLKTWTYPEKVIELGDKFKAAKAKAESTGDATFTEKNSLRFTGIKL
jgi:hypothetical protein